jgi:hypothetical protein
MPSGKVVSGLYHCCQALGGLSLLSLSAARPAKSRRRPASRWIAATMQTIDATSALARSVLHLAVGKNFS